LKDLPPVSVIVPVGRHEEGLSCLLDAVLSQEYPHFELVMTQEYEGVIPVAMLGGSASDDRVKILTAGKGNASKLRNLGARHASFDMLVFLDSDCVPERNWLRELVAAKMRSGSKIVVGETRSSNSRNSKWAEVAARRYKLWFQGSKKGNTLTRLDTKNMLVERDFLESLGMFDEDLDSKEDRDLSLRVQKRGEMIGHAESAIVLHRDPETLRDIYGRAVWYARGMRQFRAKHGMGFFSRAGDPIFHKSYVKESRWLMVSLPFLVAAAALWTLGSFGLLFLTTLGLGISSLVLAFRSFFRYSAKLVLRRCTKEEFIFDLVSDIGHKIGYISALFGAKREKKAD